MEYIVYVRSNADGYITHVNSSAFLADASGWAEIDRGDGDRYHHAQSNYLPGGVRTRSGVYRWRLVDGFPVACTAEEIAAQEAARPGPGETPTFAQLDAAYAAGVNSL